MKSHTLVVTVFTDSPATSVVSEIQSHLDSVYPSQHALVALVSDDVPHVTDTPEYRAYLASFPMHDPRD